MSKTVIKNKIESIKPSGFMDYRRFLQNLFKAVKAEVEDYDYRKFAVDLGFSATTVIRQIITGSRPLSAKAGEKISVALKLKGPEKRYFAEMIAYRNAKTAKDTDVHLEKLIKIRQKLLPTDIDKVYLEYFNEWFHPVIRELVGQKSFNPDPDIIAKRLIPNIRPDQVRKSLVLLEKLEMISFDSERERWIQTESRADTGAKVSGVGLIKYHRKMLDLGKNAMTRIPGKKRDISAVTLSVDEKTAKKMREMIHNFQLELMEEAEKSSSGDKIYQVNIQFFPVAE